MGLKIFESSGTFNPADFGLKAGDTLYIICVGGGGGGGYDHATSKTTGTAGGASSFGSYVTATGGNFAYNQIQGGAQANSVRGSRSGSYTIVSGTSTSTVYYGGSGGDGWYPGIQVRMAASPPNGGMSDNFGHQWNIGSTTYNTTTAAIAYPGYGNDVNIIGGSGGLGYGGGGGGGKSVANTNNVSYGGNGGQVIYSSVLLSSTSSIAVTVGAGGKGSYYQNNYYGGAGAKGCVAVFW